MSLHPYILLAVLKLNPSGRNRTGAKMRRVSLMMAPSSPRFAAPHFIIPPVSGTAQQNIGM
jgi:hypothetical protein